MMHTIYYTCLSSRNIQVSSVKVLHDMESGTKKDKDFSGKANRSNVSKYRNASLQSVYGIQTNEAAIKNFLSNDADGKIDELILAVSKDVYRDSVYEKKLDQVLKNVYLQKKTDTAEMKTISPFESTVNSTIEYFLEELKYYCENVLKASDIHERISEIFLYPIQDSPTADEMTKCAMGIAAQILQAKHVTEQTGEAFRILIDSTGGKRDQVLMQVGLLRTLQVHGIDPEAIYYSDFNPGKENWGENPVEILDKKSSYNIFDLVSGIDEFVEYGRAKKLKKYFETQNADGRLGGNNPSGNDMEFQKVLDAADRMSREFTTCFTSAMIDSVRELVRAIDKFMKKPKTGALQGYIVHQIRDDLGEDLYNAENDDAMIFPLIKWCFRKNFYQQAITLYVEKMQDWYKSAGILKRNPRIASYGRPHGILQNPDLYRDFYVFTEQIAFQQGLVDAYDLKRNEFKRLHQDASERDSVIWALRQVLQQLPMNGRSGYHTYIEDEIQTMESADVLLPVDEWAGLLDKKVFISDLCNAGSYGFIDKDGVYEAKRRSLENMIEYQKANGRTDTFPGMDVMCNGYNTDHLIKILEYYLAFKIIRNNINHANGELDDCARAVLEWLKGKGVISSSGMRSGNRITYEEEESLIKNAINFNESLLPAHAETGAAAAETQGFLQISTVRLQEMERRWIPEITMPEKGIGRIVLKNTKVSFRQTVDTTTKQIQDLSESCRLNGETRVITLKEGKRGKDVILIFHNDALCFVHEPQGKNKPWEVSTYGWPANREFNKKKNEEPFQELPFEAGDLLRMNDRQWISVLEAVSECLYYGKSQLCKISKTNNGRNEYLLVIGTERLICLKNCDERKMDFFVQNISVQELAQYILKKVGNRTDKQIRMLKYLLGMLLNSQNKDDEAGDGAAESIEYSDDAVQSVKNFSQAKKLAMLYVEREQEMRILNDEVQALFPHSRIR